MSKTPHCGCRNHLKNPKQMYEDAQDAIHAIVTRHIDHGAHEIYSCPKVEGIYHVQSHRHPILKQLAS